jgi:hypothetical protein
MCGVAAARATGHRRIQCCCRGIRCARGNRYFIRSHFRLRRSLEYNRRRNDGDNNDSSYRYPEWDFLFHEVIRPLYRFGQKPAFLRAFLCLLSAVLVYRFALIKEV